MLTDTMTLIISIFCLFVSLSCSIALISLIWVLYRTKRIKQIVVYDILDMVDHGIKRYTDYEDFKHYYRKKLKRMLKEYMIDDDLYWYF